MQKKKEKRSSSYAKTSLFNQGASLFGFRRLYVKQAGKSKAISLLVAVIAEPASSDGENRTTVDL